MVKIQIVPEKGAFRLIKILEIFDWKIEIKFLVEFSTQK